MEGYQDPNENTKLLNTIICFFINVNPIHCGYFMALLHSLIVFSKCYLSKILTDKRFKIRLQVRGQICDMHVTFKNQEIGLVIAVVCVYSRPRGSFASICCVLMKFFRGSTHLGLSKNFGCSM